MEDIVSDLIKGKTIFGKWFVRPVEWVGSWKTLENGERVLFNGATLFQSDNEADCDSYIANYRLMELLKKDPATLIIPLAQTDVKNSNNAYLAGKINTVEVKEYAINKWVPEQTMLFKDNPAAEDILIKTILEHKYGNIQDYLSKAREDAEKMWANAIILKLHTLEIDTHE